MTKSQSEWYRENRKPTCCNLGHRYIKRCLILNPFVLLCIRPALSHYARNQPLEVSRRKRSLEVNAFTRGLWVMTLVKYKKSLDSVQLKAITIHWLKFTFQKCDFHNSESEFPIGSSNITGICQLWNEIWKFWKKKMLCKESKKKLISNQKYKTYNYNLHHVHFHSSQRLLSLDGSKLKEFKALFLNR